MGDFFELLRDYVSDIIVCLSKATFRVGPYDTNLVAIFVAFAVVAMIVVGFWKGVRR